MHLAQRFARDVVAQCRLHLRLVDKVAFGKTIGFWPRAHAPELRARVIDIFRAIAFDRAADIAAVGPEHLQGARAFIVENDGARNVERVGIALKDQGPHPVARQKQPRGQPRWTGPHDHNRNLIGICGHGLPCLRSVLRVQMNRPTERRRVSSHPRRMLVAISVVPSPITTHPPAGASAKNTVLSNRPGRNVNRPAIIRP